MLINESGLVRAIKSAYKHGGYTVNNQGDTMDIYTETWFVKCKRAMLPRKALATIVEHMGMIPDENGPVSIGKDGDPQQVIQDLSARRRRPVLWRPVRPPWRHRVGRGGTPRG